LSLWHEVWVPAEAVRRLEAGEELNEAELVELVEYGVLNVWTHEDWEALNAEEELGDSEADSDGPASDRDPEGADGSDNDDSSDAGGADDCNLDPAHADDETSTEEWT
jgi:hypothetical protein